ncbi:hypothetical protein ACIPYS_29395 [Kitasatospora sp. NPDC089913]|uniref:hypothetical protein n=1 Tax=Streptomycetaceae TaxID=2062 RepID=UPI00087A67CA|nr:hypothetical protein [Streptomyces sp. TLI_053]SDT82841.1 hypothetical protein SAMN05216371_7648 [Streptomyces sp. TLI_053]
MTTTAQSASATALAVGIHRDHRRRLLLRLHDGQRAVSLPLSHHDIARIPEPEPTGPQPSSIVRWLSPPLAVRIRTVPGGRGVLFTGLAAPAPGRSHRPAGDS